MPRLLVVLALAAALLAAGPWAPADAAKRKRTACERLGGEDLAPAPRLKVVKRVGESSITVRACTLRGGRVRTLASYRAESPFEDADIDVAATTDRYVLLAERYSERGSGQSLTRVDARTRRSTTIASGNCDPQGFCQGSRALESVMHPSGAVVAITRGFPPCCSTPEESVPAKVELAAVDGTRTVLDEAPGLAQLALEGDEVVWLHDGRPRRAPIG